MARHQPPTEPNAISSPAQALSCAGLGHGSAAPLWNGRARIEIHSVCCLIMVQSRPTSPTVLEAAPQLQQVPLREACLQPRTVLFSRYPWRVMACMLPMSNCARRVPACARQEALSFRTGPTHPHLHTLFRPVKRLIDETGLGPFRSATPSGCPLSPSDPSAHIQAARCRRPGKGLGAPRAQSPSPHWAYPAADAP